MSELSTSNWIALAGLGVSILGNVAFLYIMTRQAQTITSYQEQAKKAGVILINPH